MKRTSTSLNTSNFGLSFFLSLGLILSVASGLALSADNANTNTNGAGEKSPVVSTATTTAAVSASPSDALSYAQLLKLLGEKNAKKKFASRVVGKTLTANLIATGPQSLMVKRADMIFFVCDRKASGFKAGKVTSKITKVTNLEPMDDGEITFYLAECKN